MTQDQVHFKRYALHSRTRACGFWTSFGCLVFRGSDEYGDGYIHGRIVGLASCLCSSCLFFFFSFVPFLPSKGKGKMDGNGVVRRRILCPVPPLNSETSTNGSISPPLSPFSSLHSPFPFPQCPGTVRTEDRETGSISEDSHSIWHHVTRHLMRNHQWASD